MCQPASEGLREWAGGAGVAVGSSECIWHRKQMASLTEIAQGLLLRRYRVAADEGAHCHAVFVERPDVESKSKRLHAIFTAEPSGLIKLVIIEDVLAALASYFCRWQLLWKQLNTVLFLKLDQMRCFDFCVTATDFGNHISFLQQFTRKKK